MDVKVNGKQTHQQLHLNGGLGLSSRLCRRLALGTLGHSLASLLAFFEDCHDDDNDHSNHNDTTTMMITSNSQLKGALFTVMFSVVYTAPSSFFALIV